MTQIDKLDKILYGLMSRQLKRYESGTDNKLLTFDFLCSTLFKDENMEYGEIAYLRDFLLEDGYIAMIHVDEAVIPDLTHKGKKFIIDGGYQKEHRRKELQDELVETGVKSNKRSKWALFVSIISILVAIAAIIFR